MAKHLLVIAGPDKDRAFPLADPDMQVIGSSRNHTEICLHDTGVSRAHCEIRVEDDRVTVTDLDSSGGTFVNGTRIAGETEIKPGDVIGAGTSQICLKAGEMPRPGKGDAAEVDQSYGVTGTPAERLASLAGTAMGHYQLESLLAKGHVGAVYRARDPKARQFVAVKVLNPDFPHSDAEKQQFLAAMKSMVSYRHPNLVSLVGVGRTGGYCWLAMEYVEGESLVPVVHRIATAGMFDWKQAFRVAVQIARALEFVHEHHVVHGNVTLENILLRQSDKTAKLNDLFLTTALKGSHLRQVTWQQKTIKELNYLPPEMTKGGAQPDQRSDLYGLGAAVYALLTGRPPCGGHSHSETIQNIRKTAPVKPKTYQMSLPDTFEGVVMKLLTKQPEARYQTAKEVVSDLERVARNMGMLL
jgi:serine/threonine protein kinase